MVIDNTFSTEVFKYEIDFAKSLYRSVKLFCLSGRKNITNRINPGSQKIMVQVPVLILTNVTLVRMARVLVRIPKSVVHVIKIVAILLF